VVDIGGTRVKMRTADNDDVRRFRSGRSLTPDGLMRRRRGMTEDGEYDAVAIGYPGRVAGNRPAAEPGNLGAGWVGFDFEYAFGRPVRVVNDAVLQALGAYDSGRMLFLGLGTGVGSALVTEHVVVPLELGDLPHPRGGSIASWLGREGLRIRGPQVWHEAVAEITPLLRDALLADYVAFGGGNARRLHRLPEHARRGGNEDAFTGGFRLWEEMVEPHDRIPEKVWRVVR